MTALVVLSLGDVNSALHNGLDCWFDLSLRLIGCPNVLHDRGVVRCCEDVEQSWRG